MATLTVTDTTWHTSPSMNVKASLTVERASSTSSSVHVYGTVYFRMTYSGGYYYTPYYQGANRGLSVVVATPQDSSGNIGSLYNMDSTNWNYSIYVDTNLTFTSGSLTLYIDCKYMTNGNCDQGYNHVGVGSLDISSVPYNPWSDPTNLSNVTVSAGSIKPDGSTTVSWTAASGGTGNYISKYKVSLYSSRIGSWTSAGETTSTSKSVKPIDYVAKNKVRVGDSITFAVAAYMVSEVSGHSSGWLTAVNSPAVSVYKDGSINYKNSNGNAIEVTKGYYKDNSGNTKKLRYAKVKTSSGATKIIDVYTEHYE